MMDRQSHWSVSLLDAQVILLVFSKLTFFIFQHLVILLPRCRPCSCWSACYWLAPVCARDQLNGKLKPTPTPWQSQRSVAVVQHQKSVILMDLYQTWMVGYRSILLYTCHNETMFLNSSSFGIWATSWQNQQNGMCAQRRLRSAWASPQSDQSLRCALNG